MSTLEETEMSTHSIDTNFIGLFLYTYSSRNLILTLNFKLYSCQLGACRTRNPRDAVRGRVSFQTYIVTSGVLA